MTESYLQRMSAAPSSSNQNEGNNDYAQVQQRIMQAHQNIKRYQNDQNLQHEQYRQGGGNQLNKQNFENHSQNLTEDDEIEIELKDLPNQNQQQNKIDELSLSGRTKQISDHYKQFYGGEEFLGGNNLNASAYNSNNPLKKQPGLGTFFGVYLPCAQNILSVVLFLRMSYIIGEAGLIRTLFILILCSVTTFLTVISMSAIATNGKIRGGGIYYLVSRSLGPSLGGSIGILYYLASTFSIALNILSAVETFILCSGLRIGSQGVSTRLYGLIILVPIIILNLFSVRILSKTRFVIVLFVFISILAMMLGLLTSRKRSEALQEKIPGLTGLSNVNFKANIFANFQTSEFPELIALFFNACTCILAGANSSADLKNPTFSIPRGTIIAHLSTTLLYFVFILLLTSCATRDVLINQNFILAAEIAWPQRWVVFIGIMLSSIGAALQQLGSSTQILQAIVDDEMFPQIITKIFKSNYQKCLFLTSFLCLVSLSFGSLDQVAPLVTIFYLFCYGGVNASCLVLDLLGSPNWRPRWKYYHKSTSFSGAVMCITSMIIISWWATLLSIIGALLIYAYFEKKSQAKNWGDGVEGIRQERARNALLKIDKSKKHVKNWRPHYLALGSVNEKGKISAPGIFKLLHQLRKGTGLAIYGCVIKGDYTAESFEEARKKESELDNFMRKNKYNAFSKVIVSQNIEQGMLQLMQSSGLGGLEPNTIVLAYPKQWEDDTLKASRFVSIIKNALIFGHLLTVLKPQKAFDIDIKHQGSIDIWSFNFEKGMLLLIAQILLKSSYWKRCTVRLFILTSLSENESETIKRVAREFLERYRLLSVGIYLEVVHVESEVIEQFTVSLNDTLQNKEKLFQQAIKEGNKDFEYGTLPSLMKLKALQEQEQKIAQEQNLHRRTNQNVDVQQLYQDSEQQIENAKKINKILLERSKDASLVITNLPPIAKGQSAQDYLTFCQYSTENLKRVLYISNQNDKLLQQLN